MNDNIQRNGNIAMLIAISVMVIISMVLYPSLPDELPRQWGMDGSVNSTWSKNIAVLVAPALGLFIWVLTLIIPKIDPHRESYEKFGAFYMRFRVTLVLFFVGLHIVTLTQYNNPEAVIRLIIVGLGMLFMVLGNELGRVRKTWFFGIRTPWTISDERVWKKTHRVGGRWFVGVGFVSIVLALILPLEPMFLIVIGGIVAVSLGLSAYSYMLYRRYNG
ncbi:MAG: SdpI family protein [Chloroflexota bacterium]